MKRFWEFRNQKSQDGGPDERVLELNGTIAEESWFGDEVTPEIFKSELLSGSGPITVLINSPGGDCIAASQIYTMLKEYGGEVTIKVDGIAASAASVVAMAGDKVLMSPTALMMIHNPSTIAEGDHRDMAKAIEVLAEVKESIINAYALKTGLSRAVLSHLMDDETWMNAKKAIQLKFADGTIGDAPTAEAYAYSKASCQASLINRLKDSEPEPTGRDVRRLYDELETLKRTI